MLSISNRIKDIVLNINTALMKLLTRHSESMTNESDIADIC